MSEKKELTYKESMALEKAIEYLEGVIADLKQGKYVLEKAGDSLIFEPENDVKLEVEVKHKNGAQKLELELSWKAEGEEEEDDEGEAALVEETKEILVEPEGAKEERKAAGVVKVIPLAALAGAGAATYKLVKSRRKSKLEKAADKVREEGEKLVEQAEEAIEEGTKKAKKFLKKERKAKGKEFVRS